MINRRTPTPTRSPWTALAVTAGCTLALFAACAVDQEPNDDLTIRAAEEQFGESDKFDDYCGPGFCEGGSFCDQCVCYIPTAPISIAACGCDLIDPSCGVGECVNGSYCDGPGCPGSAVCWSPDSQVSQVMCQGAELGKDCGGSEWSCDDAGSYCGPDGCSSPTSGVSQLVCECGLLDPACGLGSCFGGSYCDGPGCPGSGVCWAPNTTVSQVMCQGGVLDDCDVTAFEDCLQPPTNMVAWWTLDETSGTLSNDETWYANDGTHVDAPTPVPGMVDGALEFDGVDDAVQVPDDSSLDFTDGVFSVDFWIHPDDTETLGTIMLKGAPSPDHFFLGGAGFHLYYANGHILGFFANGSSGLQLDLSPNFTHHVNAGQTHFVAVTVDLDDSIHLYVDGVLAKTSGPLSMGSFNLGSNAPLMLGGNPGSLPASPWKFFNGWLDEVEVFDRVLTAGEVADLYAAGANGKCKIPD
ncbi:MAG: LamG domain-containing protein [Deltaproteobacteria bacterium]|nr:LamG domain-containing protein [Deltaproteobacteria bacterium]